MVLKRLNYTLFAAAGDPRPRPDRRKVLQVTRESDDLFRLTRLGLINCFLVREADGFTLVDTNLPHSAPKIAAVAKELGAPVRRILLTHAHFDHGGSVDALAALLPGMELLIGKRESRLLRGDRSLDPGESGKALLGFRRVQANPTRLVSEGQRIGSLLAVSSPGHTPGHFSFLDTRDGTLIAGDAVTTQGGLTVAGAFRWRFPMAWLFCWNPALAAESARKLMDLSPTRLATGHGPTVQRPGPVLARAVEPALRKP